MTTTTDYTGRHRHLQGLLQRKRLLCATEAAREPRAPDRELAARNRQLDHLLDQLQTKRADHRPEQKEQP